MASLSFVSLEPALSHGCSRRTGVHMRDVAGPWRARQGPRHGATLAEPWRATAERSQLWRASETADRITIEPEVIQFVRWPGVKRLRATRSM